MDLSIIIIVNQIIGVLIAYLILNNKRTKELSLYKELTTKYESLVKNFEQLLIRNLSAKTDKVFKERVFAGLSKIDYLQNRLSDYLRFEDIYHNHLKFQTSGKVPKGSGGANNPLNKEPTPDDKLNALKRKKSIKDTD